ncbi:hypothetical protein LTR49_024649 [Elasticomyces elasticus]|nr:hypothetical protein LTR49_024649 [Elasticomyces elasticus]
MFLELTTGSAMFFFSGVTTIGLCWAWSFLPELSGKSLEAIVAVFELPWYKIGRLTIERSWSQRTILENNGPVPSTLVPLPAMTVNVEVDRVFKFEKDHDKYLINGVGFDDVRHRILARPSRGDTEVWSVENHSSDWDHPIHIHMVDFEILSSEKGRGALEPYEQVAMKDVVVLGPDERATIRVKFAPYNGLEVEDLGYDEADLAYSDPFEARWRAKLYTSDVGLSASMSNTLQMFAATRAYTNVSGVQSALDSYWARNASHTSGTSSKRIKQGFMNLLWAGFALLAIWLF